MVRRPPGACATHRTGAVAGVLAAWMVLVALLGSVHLADGSHVATSDGGLSHRTVIDLGQPAHVACVDHQGVASIDLAGGRPAPSDHCWLTDQAPARPAVAPPATLTPLTVIQAPPATVLAERRFAQRVLAHAPKTSPPV